MVPFGSVSERYSPEASSLKFVCSGAPGTRRFLPEANTTMKLPEARLVAGKSHSVGLPALSLKAQLSRLTLAPDVFWISIQSEVSPSSSYNVWVLLAMNSVMRTWAGAARVAEANKRTAN